GQVRLVIPEHLERASPARSEIQQPGMAALDRLGRAQCDLALVVDLQRAEQKLEGVEGTHIVADEARSFVAFYQRKVLCPSNLRLGAGGQRRQNGKDEKESDNAPAAARAHIMGHRTLQTGRRLAIVRPVRREGKLA